MVNNKEIEKLLEEKINYHKNMANPPLDSLPVKDVKKALKSLKEQFQKEIKELQGELMRKLELRMIQRFKVAAGMSVMKICKEEINKIFKKRFG